MEANQLHKAKFYAILATTIVLIVTLCLSSAISSLTNTVIIRNSGQISTDFLTITAASGYWQDIQAAIDWVVAHGGIGNIYIPEGTFNFVQVGESWTGARVVIPAGVSIYGATTEKTSGLSYDGVGINPNDQVVEWKTILVMPWDAPSGFWFEIVGDGDSDKPSRFSDIKLVGYRSIDQNSITKPTGVLIECVVNYRVDHCYFENIAGGGVSVTGQYLVWDWRPSKGVIDHCYFVNTKGYVVAAVADCTVTYGVGVARACLDVWEEDISVVLGKYTDYTCVIEDCYFEKWRHCVAANSGAHYVFRHNTIKDDYGYGSLDAHGWFQTRCINPSHGTITNPSATWNGIDWVCSHCGAPLRNTKEESYFHITQVGTRAVELYNNEIVDAIQYGDIMYYRGGSGVVFNNRVGGGTYQRFVYLGNEARPEGSKCWCNDIWVWNNTLLSGITLINRGTGSENIVEGENYYLHAPHTFDYEPYSYPHPLTIEKTS